MWLACRKAQLFKSDGNSLTDFLLLLANTNNTQTLERIGRDTFWSPQNESMWLINVHTYRLEYFPERPRGYQGYAILSHTWNDEEVFFQGIQDLERARCKKGHQKIQFTCDEARRDDLYYAWVDTCCIDKTSSAELSEAINSMFNYYRESEVCYVYLSDVTATYKEVVDLDHTAMARSLLAKSRWFRRGWTLQELIAPTTIEFFTRDWQYIGSKARMAVPLATITGIHLPVLRDSNALELYSAAQRMSWAADRETTRLEDRAYSLLGLFDINMPLLYGEGKNAFTRLQQEIVKGSDDHSIFLWSPVDYGSNIEGLLAPSPDYFRDAGKIVAFKYFANRPFEFTNSGLRIQLCEKSSDGRKFLVFNCRYCDDFRGPIMVAAKHTEDDVASSGGLRGPEIPHYTLNRALHVLPFEELSKLEPKTCFLLERMQHSMQLTRSPPLSFWFREGTTFSDHFWVSEVYPRELWNAASSVMQWPHVPEFEAWGSITWQKLRSDFFVTLIFKTTIDVSDERHHFLAVAYTNHGLSKTDCQRWVNKERHPKDKTTLHHIRAGSDESAFFVKQEIVPFSGPEHLSFSAANQYFFDHSVCVVDISLEDSAYEKLQAIYKESSLTRNCMEDEGDAIAGSTQNHDATSRTWA